MKMITPHPHQLAMVSQIRNSLRSGHRRVLLQLATGAGKTVTAGEMVSKIAARGQDSLFIVHRIELVKQTVRTLQDGFGVQCGVIAAGFDPQPSLLSQVAMIGSLGRRLATIKPPRCVFLDEAHHANAETYRNVLKAFPEAKVIGLTATPERLDGRGLGEIFDDLIIGPSVDWLIENKFLSPFRAFSLPGADTSSLEVRRGDFAQEQAAELMDKPTITGDAVQHYREIVPPGTRMIVFCADVQHSKSVAEAYRKAGIPAEHVDGDTPEREREAAISRFAAGETLVLCNVALFGEGFDVPACGAVQFLRPTLSLALYLQQAGRALRYEPGKIAYLLDHVGLIKRFDLPSKPREWSLVGKRRPPAQLDEDREPDFFSVQCPAPCWEWIQPGRQCPYCGREMPVKQRMRFLKVVPGDLVEVYRKELMEDARGGEVEEVRLATRTEAEIQADASRRKAEAIARIAKARTLQDFQDIAKDAGYKSGWAFLEWQKRFGQNKGGKNAA